MIEDEREALKQQLAEDETYIEECESQLAGLVAQKEDLEREIARAREQAAKTREVLKT